MRDLSEVKRKIQEFRDKFNVVYEVDELIKIVDHFLETLNADSNEPADPKLFVEAFNSKKSDIIELLDLIAKALLDMPVRSETISDVNDRIRETMWFQFSNKYAKVETVKWMPFQKHRLLVHTREEAFKNINMGSESVFAVQIDQDRSGIQHIVALSGQGDFPAFFTRVDQGLECTSIKASESVNLDLGEPYYLYIQDGPKGKFYRICWFRVFS